MLFERVLKLSIKGVMTHVVHDNFRPTLLCLGRACGGTRMWFIHLHCLQYLPWSDCSCPPEVRTWTCLAWSLHEWDWCPTRGSRGFLCPFQTWGHRDIYNPEEALAWHWDLRLQPPEPWEVNFCCLSATWTVVFRYSSPNRVRRCPRIGTYHTYSAQIATYWWRQ